MSGRRPGSIAASSTWRRACSGGVSRPAPATMSCGGGVGCARGDQRPHLFSTVTGRRSTIMRLTAWVRRAPKDFEFIDCGTDTHSSEILEACSHQSGSSRLGITAEEIAAIEEEAARLDEEIGPMLHWLAYQHGWCRISLDGTQGEFGVSASSENLARVGVAYLARHGLITDVVQVDIDDRFAVPQQSVALVDDAIDRFRRGAPLCRLNRPGANERLRAVVKAITEYEERCVTTQSPGF